MKPCKSVIWLLGAAIVVSETGLALEVQQPHVEPREPEQVRALTYSPTSTNTASQMIAIAYTSPFQSPKA
jgi:hypothetical protein